MIPNLSEKILLMNSHVTLDPMGMLILLFTFWSAVCLLMFVYFFCRYYADVANECQIFHICYPVTYADGAEEMFKWSFICPNGTIFDQVHKTFCWQEI